MLRLHLLGMNNFAALRDLENSAATGHKGRLNPTSRLVETRILEAWGLIPETDISDIFCDEDALRTVVLQKLLMATGEWILTATGGGGETPLYPFGSVLKLFIYHFFLV